ncbi:hypothetical protein MP228_000146 [Amoeboaphelidium protococcarum]|nr:hypothetical protein MP228_000146 [Amoeboaphelidium protococcarum]
MFKIKSSSSGTNNTNNKQTLSPDVGGSRQEGGEKKERRGSISSFVNFGRRSSKASVKDQASPTGSQQQQSSRQDEDNNIPQIQDFVDNKDFVKGLPSILKALFQEDQEKFRELISKKKADLGQADKKCGRNLFHWSALLGRTEFAKMAVDTTNNAKDILNAINAVDSDGRTPLCLAVITQRIDLLRVLMNESTAALNVIDKHGKSPLHYAMYNDDLAVCTVLILRGANVNEINKSSGEPILIESILRRHYDVAQFLIKNNCNLQLLDRSKRNALHHAVIEQCYDICKALIDKGIDMDTLDYSGLSPMEYAKDAMTDVQEDLKNDNSIDEDSVPAVAIYKLLVNANARRNYEAEDDVEDIISSRELNLGDSAAADDFNESMSANGKNFQTMPHPHGNSQISNSSAHQTYTMPRIVVDNQESSRKSLLIPEVVINNKGVEETVVYNPLSRRGSLKSGVATTISMPRKLSMIAQSNQNSTYETNVHSSNDIDMFGSQPLQQSTKSSGDELFNDRKSQNSTKSKSQLSVSNASNLFKSKSVGISGQVNNNESHSQQQQKSQYPENMSDAANPQQVHKYLQLEEKNRHLKDTLAELMNTFVLSGLVEIGDSDNEDQMPQQALDAARDMITQFALLKTQYEQQSLDVQNSSANMTAIQSAGQINAELQEALLKIQQLEAQNESVKASQNKELSELQDNFKSVQNEKSLLQKQFTDSQQALSSLRSQLQAKDIQIVDLESDLSEQKTDNEQLQVNLTKAIQSNLDLKKQLELMSHSSSNGGKNVNVVSSEQIASLVKDLKTKDEENFKLRREMLQKQVESDEKLKSMRQELENGNQKLALLRREAEDKERLYMEVNASSKSNRHSGNHSLSSIGEEPFSSKEQLYVELSSELNAVQHRLNLEIAGRKELEGDMAALASEKTKLETQLISSKQQIVMLEANLNRLEDSQTDALTRSKDDQSLAIKLELDQFKVKESKLLADIEALNVKISLVSSQRDELLTENQGLQSKCKIFQSDSQRMEVSMANYVSKIDQLNYELTALKASNGQQSNEYMSIIQQNLDQERTSNKISQQEIEQAYSSCVELQSQVDQLEFRVAQVSKEKTEVAALNQTVTQELLELKQQYSAVQLKLTESQRSCDNYVEIESKLSKELKEREEQLTVQMNKERELNDVIAHLTKDLAKAKSDLLNADKQMFEANSADKAEIRSLQSQLKDKITSVENRDRLLSKAKDEFEYLQKELNEAQKAVEKERERATAEMFDLTIQAEESKTKLNEQSEKIYQLLRTKADLENKLADAQRKVESSMNFNQDQLEKQIADLRVKYDLLKEEYGKLGDSAQSLKKKLSKTERELREQVSSLNESNALKMDLEREKDVLVAQNFKVQQQLNECLRWKKDVEDTAEMLVNRLDDALIIQSPTTQERRRKSSSLANVKPEVYLSKMEAVWDDLDEIPTTMKSFTEKLHSITEQHLSSGPSSKVWKRVFVALKSAIENSLGQRVVSMLDSAADNCSRYAQELQGLLKSYEKMQSDSAAVQQMRQQLQFLEQEKKAVEDKYRELTLIHGMQQDELSQTKKVVADFQMQSSVYTNRVIDLEKNCAQLQMEVAVLDAERQKASALSDQLNQVQSEFAKLRSDYEELENLLDQTVAASDGGADLNVEQILALKQKIASQEQPVKQSQQQQKQFDHPIPPPLAALDLSKRRMISVQDRKDSFISGQTMKLQAQIQQLQYQLKLLEEKHAQDLASWKEEKQSLVNQIESDKVFYNHHVESNRHLLLKYERLMTQSLQVGRFAAEDQEMAKMALQKLNLLHDARLKVERAQQSADRKIRQLTEREDSVYVRQYQECMKQLNLVTQAYQMAKQEILNLKGTLSELQSHTSTQYKARNRLEEQLAEVKLLLSYNGNTSKRLK